VNCRGTVRHVRSLFDEVEAEKLRHRLTADLGRPGPIEVAQRLERSDLRVEDTTLETASAALTCLDLEELFQPRFACDLAPVSDGAVQPDPRGALAQVSPRSEYTAAARLASLPPAAFGGGRER